MGHSHNFKTHSGAFAAFLTKNDEISDKRPGGGGGGGGGRGMGMLRID